MWFKPLTGSRSLACDFWGSFHNRKQGNYEPQLLLDCSFQSINCFRHNSMNPHMANSNLLNETTYRMWQPATHVSFSVLQMAWSLNRSQTIVSLILVGRRSKTWQINNRFGDFFTTFVSIFWLLSTYLKHSLHFC